MYLNISNYQMMFIPVNLKITPNTKESNSSHLNRVRVDYGTN